MNPINYFLEKRHLSFNLTGFLNPHKIIFILIIILIY